MSDYLMPAKNGLHEVVIDKSRFICHVYRIWSVEEANEHIEAIKKEHAKANHNCVAYQIGDKNEIQRAFDDGEPTGTAGVPMLDVLKRGDIRNCLVVVTRYFGGVKLGTGGLIRAYGSTVSAGIQTVGLVRRVPLVSVWLNCDYSLSEVLQSKIHGLDHGIGNVEYGERVKIEALVEKDKVDQFVSWVVEVTNNRVIPTIGAISYQEIPI